MFLPILTISTAPDGRRKRSQPYTWRHIAQFARRIRCWSSFSVNCLFPVPPGLAGGDACTALAQHRGGRCPWWSITSTRQRGPLRRPATWCHKRGERTLATLLKLLGVNNSDGSMVSKRWFSSSTPETHRLRRLGRPARPQRCAAAPPRVIRINGQAPSAHGQAPDRASRQPATHPPTRTQPALAAPGQPRDSSHEPTAMAPQRQHAGYENLGKAGWPRCLGGPRGGGVGPAGGRLFTDPRLVDLGKQDPAMGWRVVLGPVTKDKNNPLLVEDQLWDVRWDNTYITSQYNLESKKFRLWYNGFASCTGYKPGPAPPSPQDTCAHPTAHRVWPALILPKHWTAWSHLMHAESSDG